MHCRGETLKQTPTGVAISGSAVGAGKVQPDRCPRI